jgi:toxin ParE1/3/4
VKYLLHPEAALEHEEQVSYYEERRRGLGRRYHRALLAAVQNACRFPHRYRIVRPPNLRRVSLRGFPLSVMYRDIGDTIQVLARSTRTGLLGPANLTCVGADREGWVTCGASAEESVHSRRRLCRVGRPLNWYVRNRYERSGEARIGGSVSRALQRVSDY